MNVRTVFAAMAYLVVGLICLALVSGCIWTVLRGFLK